MTSSTDIRIACVGLNHNTAPSAYREQIYLDNQQLLPRLLKIKQKHKNREFFAVSTCNRFELFTATTNNEILDKNILFEFFQDIQEKDSLELKDFLYFYHDKMAIKHFIDVTSSLDSMVVGETQITGQIKKALELSDQQDISGPVLQRLGQVALHTAKAIRSNTDIGKKTVSISHTAFALANRVFDNLKDKEIWIVGAGEMATVGLNYLHNKGATNVGIINRTPEKAAELGSRYQINKIHSLDHFTNILSNADVLLFAIHKPNEILTKKLLTEALKRDGRQKPLVLLDIGIPRVVDPACRELEQVFLFDIDDIQQAVKQNVSDRKKSAEQASSYIEKSSEQFIKWLQQKKVSEPLVLYKNYLGDLFDKSLESSLQKKSFKDLPSESISDIKKMLNSIQSKLLGDVARNLKDENLHPLEWCDFIQKTTKKDPKDTDES